MADGPARGARRATSWRRARARACGAFVAQAFAAVGLDWGDHVETDPALLRPTDLGTSLLDPSKAADALGWRADVRGVEVIRRMVAAERGQAPL